VHALEVPRRDSKIVLDAGDKAELGGVVKGTGGLGDLLQVVQELVVEGFTACVQTDDLGVLLVDLDDLGLLGAELVLDLGKRVLGLADGEGGILELGLDRSRTGNEWGKSPSTRYCCKVLVILTRSSTSLMRP